MRELLLSELKFSSYIARSLHRQPSHLTRETPSIHSKTRIVSFICTSVTAILYFHILFPVGRIYEWISVNDIQKTKERKDTKIAR